MSRRIKIKIFRTVVEPVLLYGSETWTLNKSDIKGLDGVYTRMLRRVLNVSWKSHTTNTVLYGSTPKLTTTIKQRRLRFAGHVHRNDQQPAQHLLFWTPSYGKRYQGRPHTVYHQDLCEDTGLGLDELRRAMEDRDVWKAV